jgi:integrase
MKMKLTEARIPTLRTAKPQEDLFHAATPGAGLRLTREGRKTWFLLYYAPGTSQKRRYYFGEHTSGKLGEARYLALKDFEREYTIARGDLAKGIDPQRKSVTVDPETAKLIPSLLLPQDLRQVFPEGVVEGTVGALLADYLQNHAAPHLTPRGYLNYRQYTRAYLTPVFKVPVLQFGEEDVRGLLSQVTKRAPQAVRRVKTVLSCAFNYGKEHIHGVRSNPCRDVKVTVPKGRRDRWLTDSEILTVAEALPKLRDRKAADVYTLILASMCRPGEAAGIQAEDIITLNGERVWKVADPKNNKDFLIPLEGPIGEVIERRILQVNGKGPLFWKLNAQDDYPRQLKEANRELRQLTKLEDIRPHDFRRTGRTHVSGLGVRDEVAEALLNHAKEAINATYNLYTYWPERKEALRLWHHRLAVIMAGGIIQGRAA